MAALEAAEAEGKRKAEEQARPLTVRSILASLGMRTEQVDRMMLAASLATGGAGKVRIDLWKEGGWEDAAAGDFDLK